MDAEFTTAPRQAKKPARVRCDRSRQSQTRANIGGVLRASGCYSAALVVLGGPRPERLARLATDTQKAWRHIPHIRIGDVFEALPYDCVPVAIDLLPGARPLPFYTHPERAFYVFGAEDATLGKATTDRCRDRVFVPTNGCMNLAATVNVVRLRPLLSEDGGHDPRTRSPAAPGWRARAAPHEPAGDAARDDARHPIARPPRAAGGPLRAADDRGQPARRRRGIRRAVFALVLPMGEGR